VFNVKLAEPGVICANNKWQVRCTTHSFGLRTDR